MPITVIFADTGKTVPFVQFVSREGRERTLNNRIPAPTPHAVYERARMDTMRRDHPEQYAEYLRRHRENYQRRKNKEVR